MNERITTKGERPYGNDRIGDVLLISVDAGEVKDRAYEHKGDLIRLYDQSDGRTVGYHLFDASNYLKIERHCELSITEEIISSINLVLKKNGIEETIEFDARPAFIIGQVVSIEKHPDADKLSLCQVNIGNETLQIVCGAPNVDRDQKVVVARIGAVMPSGLTIKEAELRGVKSFGMICSAKELDLQDAPMEKGILVLKDSYAIGSNFFAQ